MIEVALGAKVLDVALELLERVKRRDASLVYLEHGRIARHNERQAAQLLDEVRQTHRYLGAQVRRRLQQVRVVVRHAHVHERHRVEANDRPLDRLVDLRVRVEVTYVRQSLPRLRDL